MPTVAEREFLHTFANTTPPQSVAELRDMMDMLVPLLNQNAPEIGAFHEDVELRAGLRADIAVPKGVGPFAVVVYLHGGGWLAGSPKSHRKLGMQFAEAGFLTMNVDYRLAPEHQFPEGLEDCVFAIKWAAQNAVRYGGDVTRMAVGGDSAGANLTAAAITSLASEGYTGPAPRAAVLLYGVYDLPGMVKRSQAPMIEVMTKAYTGNAQYPAILDDPRVSPIHAIRAGSMPPTFVACGGADELLPESHAIDKALERAGIPHELHIFDEMPHGFLQLSNLSDCREAERRVFEFLRRVL
jgi:acetyl esterase